MGFHSINMALRFILEIAALIAMGYWGWLKGVGVLSYALAFGIPLLAATLWGVFAVPHDPSRSGKAPIPIPGLLRLALELAIFAFATWALFDLGSLITGWMLCIIVTIHYLVSFERSIWLWKN
ncbi:MAG: YrdB family protein [Bacteroidetes bacterium]|nr:YrdB family protein [Bacteroidota bacterium]